MLFLNTKLKKNHPNIQLFVRGKSYEIEETEPISGFSCSLSPTYSVYITTQALFQGLVLNSIFERDF